MTTENAKLPSPAAPTATPTAKGGGLPGGGRARKSRRAPGQPGESRLVAAFFLFPAGIWLAAIVLYPLVYTLIRSFFNDGSVGQATSFAGVQNYINIFTQSDSFEAFKNNVIWVVVVPALVTILGLIFAVLTERIRWASAFKVIVFTPMAISFLAAGITWSLIYVDQPSQGLGNAVLTGIHDTFKPSVSFPNLHPSTQVPVMQGSSGKGYTTKQPVAAGTPARLPFTGLDLLHPPANAKPAGLPSGKGLTGVVWNDFKAGGGGTPGKVDPGELGVPGVSVQALKGGNVVATTTTADNGTFAFSGLTSGSYSLRLPASDFTTAYGGVSWLGPTLITPAIIIAYLWIYAGFAMVLLAAGMAALPRETMEAARIDGATEWQVFRRVTMPLLSPVLLVVFVTMVINVLKIFDIVFVMQQPAGGNARYANVLAVQLYDEYGNQQYGAASAVGILLVLLVIPAMIFQIHNFKKSQQ
jgi:alpha-glucoside transport system permease protein